MVRSEYALRDCCIDPKLHESVVGALLPLLLVLDKDRLSNERLRVLILERCRELCWYVEFIVVVVESEVKLKVKDRQF